NLINASINASNNLPDLKIVDIEPNPRYINIFEGKELEFAVKIKNDGIIDVPVGNKITVKLRIDLDYVVSTNSSEKGLPGGSSTFINLNWTPTYYDVGIHTFSFEVWYQDIHLIHYWDYYDVKVSERDTDLEIISFDTPGTFAVNKTSLIQASIINYGENSISPIYAKLNSSEDGEVEKVVRSSILSRDETHIFYFNWTPTRFGSQKISVEIVYNSTIHDSEEKSVIVEIENLQWWDENWHYMYFLSVNGSGNVSEFFNFTEFIDDLGVIGKFENDTIRIVNYTKDGNFVNVVEEYEFKESEGFNKESNAIGTLTWNAVGAPFEKFYCIYFDVTLNQGDRDELIETQGMGESGNTTIGYFGFIDGWGIDSLQPSNGSYCLVNELIDITVSTDAKAENVSAFIILDSDTSVNSTIYLSHNGDYTLWSYDDFNFTVEGNCTIQISSIDWAGYIPEIFEHSFFVGKPDIAVINVEISVDGSPGSQKIYRNDTVNITALIMSYDANIESVNVSLSIFDIQNAFVIYTETIKTALIKDKNNYVSFSWKADASGDVNVTIILDPDDLIDEEDESNNKIYKIITVYELPDLAVVDIILPSYEKTEFDQVQIDVVIKNEGLGNAEDYEVILYIEKDVMKYKNEIDSKIVNVNANKSITVSLFWDSSRPGQWIVAAKINVTDTNRDSNIFNNRLLSDELLVIRSIERNYPYIKITSLPDDKKQGSAVTIFANITDDTGLESVTIDITSPFNKLYTNTMVRTKGDEFKFTFSNTIEKGKYDFTITAIDLSIHRNTGSKSDSFNITKDSTSPMITYLSFEPQVQLLGKDIDFICIASDNIGLQSVRIIVNPPVFPPSPEEANMQWTS
ncbi:MAG: CARDB domain-containing protein, partial [Candidatus Hodarchaeales archaeon]